MMKRFFFFSFLLLLCIPIVAQALEIQYPKLPSGWYLSQNPSVPEFIRYLYYFFLGFSGFIAVFSMVLGGIRYATSAGNPTVAADARSQMWGALLGILVLLGSYLLLTTINPQLRVFSLERGPAPLQKCDCANPTGELCKLICEPVKERKKIGSEVLEVPVGNLIERILNEQTLAHFETVSKKTAQLAKEAKDKAQAYKEELDQCSCSRKTVNPHCSAEPECKPLACTGESCDKKALESKKAALQESLNALTSYVETNIGTNISLRSGMPPGAGGNPISGGGSCGLGSDACSPSSLGAFGAAANQASQICQKESGGNILALNDGCLKGQYDYSVGLFQINLYRTGRCPGAFREINVSTCEIINRDILEACMEKYGYGDKDKNIQGALGISGNGANWCPWTTAFPPPTGCGLCER